MDHKIQNILSQAPESTSDDLVLQALEQTDGSEVEALCLLWKMHDTSAPVKRIDDVQLGWDKRRKIMSELHAAFDEARTKGI